MKGALLSGPVLSLYNFVRRLSEDLPLEKILELKGPAIHALAKDYLKPAQ